MRDRSSLVDIRNLQIIAREMFKVHGDLSQLIFKERFNKRTLNYELRHLSQLTTQRVANVYKSSKNIACLGPKIWNIVPSKLKKMSITSFLKKQWNGLIETAHVDYVKGTYEILVLFKLKIYTGVYSDPSPAASMEFSVDYFCGKLRLGYLTGFLNTTLYVYL